MVRLLDNNDQINWLLEHWEEIGLGPAVDTDIFMSILVIVNGGTIHHLSQHKDLLTNYVKNITGIAVLHQVKHYYGKTLPDNIKYLIK